MNILAQELGKLYPEIEAMQFYREIFPDDELDEWKDDPAGSGGYTAIALEFTRQLKANGKKLVKRHTITDDLDMIDELIWNEERNFCAMSPISYIGKSRHSENARFMYALVIEVDHLVVGKGGSQDGLHNLIRQWTETVGKRSKKIIKPAIPKPTYLVASGNGLHLYYLFDRPIPLYPNIAKELSALKRDLTTKIWNKYVTVDHDKDKIQYESIFQPFRVVGTTTKSGDRVKAFEIGDRITIEYLNDFVSEDHRVTPIRKSKLTLQEAKKKYPNWYESRVVKGNPRGRWVCKRDLYDWWLRRIREEAVCGHRYYCMMILAIYALKCEIDEDELEADCLELFDVFEGMTEKEDNHFLEDDMLGAIQAYHDKGLVTYTVETIAARSGIEVKRNPRNHKPQNEHLQYARDIKQTKKKNNRLNRPEGRPNQEQTVLDWIEYHPGGTKAECIKATGLSKPTVYKWWPRE